MGSINPPKNSHALNHVNSKTIATVRELYKGKVRALPHDVTLLQDEVDLETWQKPSEKIFQNLTVLSGGPDDAPSEKPSRQELWLQRNQQQQEHHSQYTNQPYNMHLNQQYSEQQYSSQPYGQQQLSHQQFGQQQFNQQQFDQQQLGQQQFGQQQFGQQQFGQQQFGQHKFDQQQFGQQQLGQQKYNQQQFDQQPQGQQPQGQQQYFDNPWSSMQRFLGNTWNQFQPNTNDQPADPRARSRSANVGGRMDYPTWDYSMGNDIYVKAKNRPKPETKRLSSASPVRRGPSVLNKQLIHDGAGPRNGDGLVVTEIGGKRKSTDFSQRDIFDKSGSPPIQHPTSVPTFFPQLPAVSPQNSWTYRRSILDTKIKEDRDIAEHKTEELSGNTEKKPEELSGNTEKKPEESSEIATEKKPEESSVELSDKKPDETSAAESDKSTKTVWQETLKMLNVISPQKVDNDNNKTHDSKSKSPLVNQATPKVTTAVNQTTPKANEVTPNAKKDGPPRTPHIPLSNITTMTVSPRVADANINEHKEKSVTPEKLSPPSNRLEIKNMQSPRDDTFQQKAIAVDIKNPTQSKANEETAWDVAVRMGTMLSESFRSAKDSFNQYFDYEENIKFKSVQNIERKTKNVPSVKTGGSAKNTKKESTLADSSLPFMENKIDTKEGLVDAVENAGQTQASADKPTKGSDTGMNMSESIPTSPKRLKDETDSLQNRGSEIRKELTPLQVLHTTPTGQMVKKFANDNGNNKSVHNVSFYENKREDENEEAISDACGASIEASNTPNMSSLQQTLETLCTPKLDSLQRTPELLSSPEKNSRDRKFTYPKRGKSEGTVATSKSWKRSDAQLPTNFNPNAVFLNQRGLAVSTVENMSGRDSRKIENTSRKNSPSRKEKGPANKIVQSTMSPHSYRVSSNDGSMTPPKKLRSKSAVDKRFTHLAARKKPSRKSSTHRLQNSASVRIEQSNDVNRQQLPLKVRYSTYLKPSMPYAPLVFAVKTKDKANDESVGGKYRCSKLFVDVSN